ncbi:DUF2235 domain-containing protein [Paracoccus ravus]|uniref:DUF2235 domain-containing protein n=1 Tax=Paracoccus ravus TaxID=2447760 RepID=UPI001FD6478D|nr:DUF2235 domain-containing protein [Paracoccus ravus]
MDSDVKALCQVVLMDGTFASLTEGQDSSIARIHALLSTGQDRVQIHYAPGQQWAAWRTLPQLVSGQTLDQNIRSAYGWLSRHWRPGNPLFFFGYSRGGIGICALAEMIETVGLLRSDAASDANIATAWARYRHGAQAALPSDCCHDHVPIRMVGLLDTVMSLGIRLPLLWSVTEPGFDYAKGRLAGNVSQGVHALALDETRRAFEPILWQDVESRTEQMWFRGCHADIGGQLGGMEAARPLANLPLVWLLSRAQEAGLPLPEGWAQAHPCDHEAPPVGSWYKWGKAFLMRGPREAGQNDSEALHPSVPRPYPGPARLHGKLAHAARVRRPPFSRLRIGNARGNDPEAAL